MESNKSSELNEFQRKVLQVITLYNRPVTMEEVAEEMGVPYKRAQQAFNVLVSVGNIVTYTSSKSHQRYYALTASKSGIDAMLAQKYADMAGSFEKQYQEVKAENAHLREQIDKLYANILTLMGIFVAIFALIVINVSAIGSYAAEALHSGDLFFTLFKLNVPLVVSISVLVLLIKYLLLSKPKE